MNELTFEIVKVIVMVVVAAVSLYLLPLIKKKIGNENLAYIDKWAFNAVLWAEQIMSDNPGIEKKEVVMGMLKHIRDEHKIGITDEQIEVLVEAGVKALNTGLIDMDIKEEG